MYLIYPSEETAWLRSEREGLRRNLSYHIGTGDTRYVTAPEQTIDGLWALKVDGFELSEHEQNTTVEKIILAEEPLET